MNRLDAETRARIVACLVEGSSVRATCRMTGAAKGTVLKLLEDLGAACSEYQHRTLRGATKSGASATRRTRTFLRG